MRFVVPREELLKPLNLVAGVVERRHTMPVLANVMVQLEAGQLSLTGSDGEVELIGRVLLAEPGEEGAITVPARKLVDICKSLPERSEVEFRVEQQRVVMKSGRSRFTLSSLPASEFPSIEEAATGQMVSLGQGQLKSLLDQTSFAMAQQDVRYYLNGMLWEMREGSFRVVATDGHRLAMATLEGGAASVKDRQLILPRKGVVELNRLLISEAEDIHLLVGDAYLRATTMEFTFTSKLVDGRFPDYQRVIPRNTDKEVLADRDEFKAALSRTAILSNEKYHGVRLKFQDNELTITANNPEQEEAVEILSVVYGYEPLEVGFNVSYLLDVMSVIKGDTVKLSLSDSNSSALLEDAADPAALYVVMPMRL